MSSSGVCRGGNGDCDCERFRPKPDEPSHCWECAHGISKHPNTDDMAAQVTQSQPASLSGSSNVAKIFQDLTAREPSGVSQPNPRREALMTKATKAATSRTTSTTNERKVSGFVVPQNR